jgi:hypothetical protein
MPVDPEDHRPDGRTLMGYAHYEVVRKDGIRIEAGYAVEDTCNQDGCNAEIDRGLDYLCGARPGGDEYGCGGYFCGEHTSSPILDDDDVPQMCRACYAAWEKQRLDEVADLIVEALNAHPGVRAANGLRDKPAVMVTLADGLEVDITVSR